MKRKLWLVFVAIALLGGLVASLIMKAQNREIRDILRAEKVLADRTLGEKGSERYDDFYKKRGKPILVHDPVASQLKALVVQTFSSEGPRKLCAATPGFVLTFVRADREYDVFVCLECYSLGLFEQGEWRNSADFVSGEFIQHLKVLFPDALTSETK